ARTALPPQPTSASPGEPTSAAAGSSQAQPLATIRQDYEREQRDADAPAAEQRIRTIYGVDSGILRDVRCSESVCKLEARWSRHWNEAYNAALLEIIAAFSRDLTLEPGGPPDGTSLPVTIYVRRQRSL
ncbi:MAG TPA: hypothetical protein VJR89_10140, partial [Polyangiales bacterium]|nr:hypothetical protein [Polyangiales bacterium]